MERDDDNFATNIRIHNKSAFMMLSFQDRVIKLFQKRRVSIPWNVKRKKM